MSLIVDIRKDLGGFCLDVKFEAESGVTCLLGASGCGKSMTLKCIAGIERPDEGHIELDGRVLYDSKEKIDLPPQQRRVGYLFQNYALFPNMTVRQNILCGLCREKDRAEKSWRGLRTTSRISSPADSSSVSPWRASWSAIRSCCCWTSPFPRLTAICATR